jgi:hypothetical protein
MGETPSDDSRPGYHIGSSVGEKPGSREGLEEVKRTVLAIIAFAASVSFHISFAILPPLI